MHKWIAPLGLLFLVAGCDALADQQTDGVALATLRGTLSLGQGVKPPIGRLRISVLWQSQVPNPDAVAMVDIDPSGIVFPEPATPCAEGEPAGWRSETPLLEQPVQLTTDFPSGFSVSLTEPPPSAALWHGETDGNPVSVASGDIVVYEDRNGNNRLDPSTFEATSPDRIFGSSQGVNPGGIGQRKRYSVMYLSRDEDRSDIKAGYSLQTFDEDPYASLDAVVQRLSDATIELTLDPTPYVQQAACTVRCEVGGESDCEDREALLAGDLGEPSADDLPLGVSVWSRQDGESTVFTMKQCTKEHRGAGFAYSLELLRVATRGCTKRTSNCLEVVGTAAPDEANLPCTEYREVMPIVPNEPAGTPP